ncbi:hypothetical protein CIPAW_01G022600 [Carya illinoinensis]|uniref:Uncharacterized protein n=1 Tax=Carya illinoinensis TaxID=32201 RepID=A0A8T1RI19_CARIL|nr:hypothetical protein CIPAW_01G022600 [Carya illinoinensis]
MVSQNYFNEIALVNEDFGVEVRDKLALKHHDTEEGSSQDGAVD